MKNAIPPNMLDTGAQARAQGEQYPKMRRYRCTNSVRAAPIVEMRPIGGEAVLNGGTWELTLEGGAKALVSQDWMRRYKPEAGGYFVRHRGGFNSYAAAAAFESTHVDAATIDSENREIKSLLEVSERERRDERRRAAILAAKVEVLDLLELVTSGRPAVPSLAPVRVQKAPAPMQKLGELLERQRRRC